MEQMITKEQIAEAAEQYAEQENSAWTNDYNGFEAGANFVMQLLQQTPCTTLREKLAEMQGFLQKPEHEFDSMHDWMDNEENKIAIYRVMKMIDALPPVA